MQSGAGPVFGITYAAMPATDAISTAPRRALLDLHDTVRVSMLDEGGGPKRDKALVKSVRGEKLVSVVTRISSNRGFLCRESSTRVGYSTARLPRPSPRVRCVYNVFLATSEGRPDTAKTKRSSALDSSRSCVPRSGKHSHRYSSRGRMTVLTSSTLSRAYDEIACCSSSW